MLVREIGPNAAVDIGIPWYCGTFLSYLRIALAMVAGGFRQWNRDPLHKA